jgi:hypothetical protein
MKKIIRHCCWETNSSSSHSLSLAKYEQEFVMDTIYPDQDGVITVFGQEFGWAWEKFNDAMTKLAYVMQDQPSKHDEIIEVVKEQTGALEVIFDENGGYIDHESYGTAHEVCYSKDSIKNFVFNKNSWLFTGNDNGEPDPMFYDVPEFKGGRQILPRYKYELVIEGLENTTKYKDYPNDENLETGIDSILENALLDESGCFVIESGLYWQITRPRNYYQKDYKIDQEYSTGEIRFMRESDPRYDEIEKEVDADKKLDWHTRHKLITERALLEKEVPSLIKRVKFELKKL